MSELEVIGAGFGRTGTASLMTALNQLGYTTHHMAEVFKLRQAKTWQQIHAGKDIDTNLKDVLSGFTACLDYPTCGYFEELMALNPNAKVLLSIRDTPEAWVKSANATVMACAYENPFRSGVLYHGLKWVPFFGNVVRLFNMLEDNFNKCAVGHFVPKYPENRVQYYEDWVAHVKRRVPSDRLLVFNVKQGWEPLCKYLAKPVPSTPFPRINSTDDFKKSQKIIKIILSILFVSIYGGLGYVTYTGRLQASFIQMGQMILERLRTFAPAIYY